MANDDDLKKEQPRKEIFNKKKYFFRLLIEKISTNFFQFHFHLIFSVNIGDLLRAKRELVKFKSEVYQRQQNNATLILFFPLHVYYHHHHHHQHRCLKSEMEKWKILLCPGKSLTYIILSTRTKGALKYL